MTELIANPARLMVLQLDALRTAKTTNKHGKVVRIRHVWANAFGVPWDDAEVARRLAGIIELSGEIRRTVEVLEPSQSEVLLPRLTKFESIVLTGLDNEDFNAYWSALGGDTLRDFVQMTVAILDDRLGPSLAVDDAEQLRDHLADLLSEVLTSDLPKDLRHDVAQRLYDIVGLFDRADTQTSSRLRQQLTALAGWAIGDQEVAKALSGSTAGRAVLSVAVAWSGLLGLQALTAEPDLPDPDPVVIQHCVIELRADRLALPKAPLALTSGPSTTAVDPTAGPDGHRDATEADHKTE